MEERIQVSFSTDGEGFISQQCRSCTRRFKVRVIDASDRSVNFCPYCRSRSGNGWLTEEQHAYAMGVVAEQVLDPVLEDFTRKLNRMNRPGGFLSLSGRYKKSARPPKPAESEEPMPVFTAPCCDEPVKHDGSVADLYCVVCGQQHSAG